MSEKQASTNTIAQLLHQIKQAESAKCVLEDYAQEIIDMHNKVYTCDHLRLSYWKKEFPVKLNSNSTAVSICVVDCLDEKCYIFCSIVEMLNPFMYYERIKKDHENYLKEEEYAQDLAVYEKLKAKLGL